MAHLQESVLISLLLLVLTHSQSDIRKPPIIQTPVSTANIYHSSNDNFAINCTADAQPPATYKWIKDGQDISSTFVSFSSTTGVLTFTQFSTRDGGIYMCIATNSFDNGQTNVASWSPRLNVQQSRIDPFFSQSSTITTTALDYVLLRCNPKTVIGADITYNWYSKNRTSISLDGDRLFIDQQGNLHFTFVRTTDSQISYRCGISNGKDSIIVLGTEYILIVAARDHVAIKPQIRRNDGGVQGLRLSSVKLECMSSGYDPSMPYNIPTIQWVDDSGQVVAPNAKYGLSGGGRVLTIYNLQEDDERTYTCVAKNSAGEAKQPLLLNVTSAPIFVNGAPRDQTKPEGTDVQFNCNARSANGEVPPALPIWYINGKTSAQYDPNKFQLSEGNRMLTIRNVKKATDIVCVQCEVTNSVGSVLANACLNVILPITILKQPSSLVQEINFGDSVDMTITATTDLSMTLRYRWEFNNKSYEGSEYPPNMYYNPYTMLAYINTSSLTEEQYLSIAGPYRRIISHLYETKVVEIDIILKDRQAASRFGIALDPWIIGLIITLILLIIVILIIIYVICRKKQEGEYNVDKKETGAGLDPEKELKDKDFSAFSRPGYDDYDYPDPKPHGGDPEYDDAPINGDDESLMEYGKEDITHFNEDGSFIGIYQSKQPSPHQPTESSI